MRPEAELTIVNGMAPPAFEDAVALCRTSIRDRLEAGRLFLAVKEASPRGTFGPCVAASGLSRSTVCLYMRVARADPTVDDIAAAGGFVAYDSARRDAKVEADRSPDAAEAPPPNVRTAAHSAEEAPAPEPSEDAGKLDAAWQAFRAGAAARNPDAFKAWLAPCRMEPRGEGLWAAVVAPTPFHASRVRQDWDDRIRAALGVPVEYEAGPAAPELPLPEGGAADGPLERPILPEGYDHRNPAHRMLLCQTLHDVPSALARSMLATLAFRDGGDGAFVSRAALARHHGCSEDWVKDCLADLRARGYLKSVRRRNMPSRDHVFPDGPPEQRQRELTLLRSLEGGLQTPHRVGRNTRRGGVQPPVEGEADRPPKQDETDKKRRTAAAR